MKYKVQAMTSDSYHLMMTGGYGYSVHNFWIEANSKEEAYEIATAQYPDLVINDYTESEEEINKHKARMRAIAEENEKKEKEKAERKLARENEKAEAMGLTYEEYQEYKKAEKNKKRHESELRSKYATIERMKREIAYEEKKIKEWEEKMKKIAKRA